MIDEIKRLKVQLAEAQEDLVTERRFRDAIYEVPLLEAVLEAGLSEEETEGPYGGGGIDHAHTIKYMGQLIKKLKAEK